MFGDICGRLCRGHDNDSHPILPHRFENIFAAFEHATDDPGRLGECVIRDFLGAHHK